MSSFAINRVVLVGRLTRDPELRALPSGRSVCSLRLACNETRLDADGSRRDRAHFFDVSAFGATAESVARFLHRGSRVAVDGRLEWREWETAEQGRRQAVSILADVVQFLDAPSGPGREGAGEGAGIDAEGVLGVDELAAVGAEELEVAL